MRRFLPLLFTLALPAATQTPGLEVGFEERVRSEAWDNLGDHDANKPDQRVHYRFRSRLWASADLTPDLQLAAGLVNENRGTARPSTYVYNGREVFFETLYLDYRWRPGLSVRVGRQNLMRGEGFVLMDGSSGDGSRSTYFNAVDLAMEWGRSKLEFLAIDDPLKDRALPVLNEITRSGEQIRLNEWDEQALGVYYTGREWTGTTLEAYAFHKTERHDYRAPSNPLFQPDRRIETLGARLVQESGPWTAMAEGAVQGGRQDGHPGSAEPSRAIHAWAVTTRLKRGLDLPWKPSASLGVTALSGQDPHSSAVTGWDPVFSRWPKWSELYIYSLVPEKGVAYWSNLALLEAEVKAKPHPRLDLRVTWYRMDALRAPAATGFGGGKHRGDLWQLRADWKFSEAVKGHALYEHLTPGSFYAFQSPGYFLRFELSLLVKTRFNR